MLEHIGTGGIGAVYRARHEETGQEVAIKIVHRDVIKRPDFVERLHREARLSYQLDHDHIVKVHTWGEEDGRHYLVMDFIDGKTLFHVIQHHAVLKWQVAAGLLRQIADAVAHVHDLGIIHRDLKPDNILVGRDGKARLADLGLARQVIDGIDEVGGRRLTAEGTVMGSPCYMAPEQISDTSKVGPAADIYGLGTTLYHAITGRPPIVGEDARETLRRVQDETPRRASVFIGDLPKPLTDIVDRCLDKDPGKRPATARELAAVLTGALRLDKQP